MYDKQTVYAEAGTDAYTYADTVFKKLIAMASSLSEGVIVLTDSTKTTGDVELYTAIEFTLWNTVKITINNSGTTGTNGSVIFNVTVIIGETEISAGSVQAGSSSGGTDRKCIIRLGISTNHDAVVLRLTPRATAVPFTLDVIVAKNGNTFIVGKDNHNTTANAMNKAFYNSATGLNQYNAYDRLGYIYPTVGQFEIMENKAFIENDTFRIQVDGLFDSTTISPDIVIMMDDKKYYSLDDHTIMEVTANAAS